MKAVLLVLTVCSWCQLNVESPQVSPRIMLPSIENFDPSSRLLWAACRILSTWSILQARLGNRITGGHYKWGTTVRLYYGMDEVPSAATILYVDSHFKTPRVVYCMDARYLRLQYLIMFSITFTWVHEFRPAQCRCNQAEHEPLHLTAPWPIRLPTDSLIRESHIGQIALTDMMTHSQQQPANQLTPSSRAVPLDVKIANQTIIII